MRIVRTETLIIRSTSVLVFLASKVTGIHSQVDKVLKHLATRCRFRYCWPNRPARSSLVSSRSCGVWGVRLTTNFAHHGGYVSLRISTGMREDHRWSYVRNGYIFRETLLAYCNAPFFSFLPKHFARGGLSCNETECHGDSIRRLNNGDECLAALCMIALPGRPRDRGRQSAIRVSNGEKGTKSNASSSMIPPTRLKGGFCSTGLFVLVRKPNYAAEQAVWVTY
jgi:steroid 5-alpha reductase family enzyme